MLTAGIALPKTAVKWSRPAQEGTNVVHGLVQPIERNCEGVTICTAGLLILSNSFYVKALQGGLIEQSQSRAQIRSPHEKFDASEKIRQKPIHPNGVLVSQETLDIGRIEDALVKKGVWQVSKATEEHESLVFG